MTHQHINYQLQYRKCGKPACRQCQKGMRGHGPYWKAGVILYTVVLSCAEGFPVRFLCPGDKEHQSFIGQADDPGGASQEFLAQYPGAVYVDQVVFERVLRKREGRG